MSKYSDDEHGAVDVAACRTPVNAGLQLSPWGYMGLLTVPLAVVGLITFYRVTGAVLFGDVEWYATALPALTSDTPLYDPSKLVPHERTWPTYWNQPPSAALFSLILLLPGGASLWGLAMVVSVVVGLALIWPRVGLGGALLLAPVMLVWLPISSVLVWGNTNALVFGLLAVAWRFPRAAGVAIGLAAAVKLVPLLAIGWLIGKRDWRNGALVAAIPVVATIIVLVWKGPDTLGDFITLQLNESYPPGPRPRWGPTDLGLPAAVAYIGAGALFAASWRYASFSLAILAMLVSVPGLHSHYLSWLAIPIISIWIPWVVSRLSGQRTARPSIQLAPTS